jgi:hypothetical protein
MDDIRKVAVISGTPVDTRMGVDFIEKKNSEAVEGTVLFETHYCPVSEDCDAQIKFQYTDDDGKRMAMDTLFDPEIAAGTRDFFIYCNSLSGAFGFDAYAMHKSAETGEDIRVYTPLQVYRAMGKQYGRVGVMAANNISTHGIEEAFMAANPDIYVIGTGNMAIVRAIEDGGLPQEIIQTFGLAEMASYMQASGAEAIVLGCTHFPYLKEEIEKLSSLPVIDPADMMFDMIDGRAE